jgi:adenylyltransferase/sulfurtransferase
MQQISVRELSARLQRGEPTYLVDVRQPWEHDLVRLPDHVLVPLQELADRADEIQPPAGALVVTYCHHGVRSLNAVAILEQLGHTNVASLAGGIDAWSQLVDPGVARY